MIMTKEKEYRSFKEIDQRLKILSLQREISLESVKLNLYRAKADLMPKKLTQGLDIGFLQNRTLKNVVIGFVTKKLLSAIRNRREKKLLANSD